MYQPLVPLLLESLRDQSLVPSSSLCTLGRLVLSFPRMACLTTAMRTIPNSFSSFPLQTHSLSRLHPTAHQTLHTGQTSTLRYLWTSGTPRPSHLHCSFTTALCSGPTMVEWPSCGRQNSRDVVHVQTQTENPPLQTASLPPSLISS